MKRSFLPLLLVVATTLALPGVPDAPSLAAQSPSDEAELRGLAGSVAERWSSDRVRTVETFLSPDGVGFHLESIRQASLEPRKVVAALEDLLNRFRSVSCTVVRVTPSSGAGHRGSAELAWEAVATGTSEVLRRTVFLGIAREGDRWRISEIRILQ